MSQDPVAGPAELLHSVRTYHRLRSEVELHFALVHGAYHGAWRWERLIPELEKRGHPATAVDLPIEDLVAGASVYADLIAAAVDGEDVVLVGQSMMGLAIPLVPQRVAVSRLVFLCAFVPEPGSSFNEVRAKEEVEPKRRLQRAQFTDIGDGVWVIGPDNRERAVLPRRRPGTGRLGHP